MDAKPVATFADHALVDRNSSQPQCVADHAERGERHGGRRDDRRQKNAEARIEHEDVELVKGKYAELLGLLQERYGHAKEQATSARL